MTTTTAAPPGPIRPRIDPGIRAQREEDGRGSGSRKVPDGLGGTRRWTLRRYLVVILLVFVISDVLGAVVVLTQADNDVKHTSLQSATQTAQQAAAEISGAIVHLTTSVTVKTPSASLQDDFSDPASCQMTFSADGPFTSGWSTVNRNDGSTVCQATSPRLKLGTLSSAAWLPKVTSLRTQPITLSSTTDSGGSGFGVLRAAPIPGLGLRAEFLSLAPLASTLAHQVNGSANNIEFVVTNSNSSVILSRSIDPSRWADANVETSDFYLSRSKAQRQGVDGQLRLYGSALVPETGWRFFVGTSTSQALAGGRHLFLRELWVILGSLALLIAALFTLDRWVSQPVRRLRSAMAGRTSGALPGPVPVAGPAEVSELAMEFNGLISNIEKETAANTRLAAIVESSDDAIIGMTFEGTITSWNRAATELYGYEPEEVVGSNTSILLPGEASVAFATLLATAARGDSIDHFDTRRVRKNGSLVDVAVTITPVRDQSGTIVSVSMAARDITERIWIEAQLARQAEDLVRSNAELEQFAYVASHDLSEPLRTISGYVELLSKRYGGKLDSDADRFIQHTVDGCSRLHNLIDDLLTFSRTGRSAELTDRVDCAQLVEEIVVSLGATLDALNGTVIVTDLPVVWGAQNQLTHLFQNLMTNSIKFAREGVAPEIRISAHRNEQMWEFTVADNGIGIDAEYRERIFGMFQRLHARSDYPGTGIGLAICKRIVEAHHGTIWVEAGDPGSVFHFTLPFEEEVSR